MFDNQQQSMWIRAIEMLCLRLTLMITSWLILYIIEKQGVDAKTSCRPFKSNAMIFPLNICLNDYVIVVFKGSIHPTFSMTSGVTIAKSGEKPRRENLRREKLSQHTSHKNHWPHPHTTKSFTNILFPLGICLNINLVSLSSCEH